MTFGRALSYRWQDGIDTADEREPDGPIIQTSVGRATIMPLPGGFERIKMVWTGHSADTKTLVQSVRSFASAHPDAFRKHLQQINEASQTGHAAWTASDRCRLLSAMTAGADAIKKLSASAEVPLHKAHTEIARIIGENGAMKPTGAGGEIWPGSWG